MQYYLAPEMQGICNRDTSMGWSIKGGSTIIQLLNEDSGCGIFRNTRLLLRGEEGDGILTHSDLKGFDVSRRS